MPPRNPFPLTNPAIYSGGPVLFTKLATSGISAGGFFSGPETPNLFQFTTAFFQSNFSGYWAGLVYGRQAPHWNGSSWFYREHYLFNGFPPDAATAFPVASHAAAIEPNPTLTLIVPNGSGGQTTYNWASDDRGLGLGMSLQMRGLWDPQLKWVGQRLYLVMGSSYNQAAVNLAATSRENWTIEQWPYGGTPVRTPSAPTPGNITPPGPGLGNTDLAWLATGTRPCWILSRRPIPFDPTDIVVSLNNSPGIADEVMIWWMPDDSQTYTPRVVLGDYFGQASPEVVSPSRFFMGSPAFHAPGTDITFNGTDNSSNNFYTDGGGTSRPLRQFPMIANPWAIDRQQVNPHLKVDSQARLPFLEFERPLWMDNLPADSCTIESATADVLIEDVRRVEYWLDFWRLPLTGYSSSTINSWLTYGFYGNGRTLSGYSGSAGKYGVHLRQRTKVAETDSDTDEQWATIFKALETISGTTGTPESGNTHDPTGGSNLLPWVARTDADAPETVVPVTAARLAHCVVGMQRWGDVTGANEADLNVYRSLKEMERYALWHPDSASFGGFDGVADPTKDYPESVAGVPSGVTNDKWHFAPILNAFGDDYDGYLDWLKGQNPDPISTLQNWRYRFLGMQNANYGLHNTVLVPPGGWRKIDLANVFLPIVNDKARTVSQPFGGTKSVHHQKYRIYPCLPRATPPATQFGGEYCNVAGLFDTLMPEEVSYPKDNGTHLHSFNLTTWKGICYQDFSNWRLRNIRVVINCGGGRTARLRVPTPWDS